MLLILLVFVEFLLKLLFCIKLLVLLLKFNNFVKSFPSIRSLLFPFKLNLLFRSGAMLCSRLSLLNNCNSYFSKKLKIDEI